MLRSMEVAGSVLLALAVGAAAAMSGCARAPQALGPAAASAQVRAASVDPSAIVARFDRLPVGATPKAVRPLAQAVAAPSRPDTPVTLEKIRVLAKGALDEAMAKPNWQAKWEVTHSAVGQIDMVQFADRKLVNLASKLGLNAALGVGYLGVKPTHEDRYKIQVEVLTYVMGTETEQALATGSPIADLAVRMMEVTTGYDGGFRVGLSMLLTLRDHYKEPKVKAAVEGLLAKVKQCASKEEGYQTMLKGLRELSLSLKK